MIIQAKLSIGYPGVIREDELEIDDEALEGLSEKEQENVKEDTVREWAEQIIEYWYEESK